jgi:hypothetical protein
MWVFSNAQTRVRASNMLCWVEDKEK